MSDKTVSINTLTWRTALQVAQAAQEHAEQIGIIVNVAVADRRGNLLVTVNDPRNAIHGQSIAADKAHTAAGFGMPSSQVHGMISGMNSPALDAGFPLIDKMVMFGGGAPIFVDGELVAGIGVSGGSEEQDEACAMAAITATGLLAAPQ